MNNIFDFDWFNRQENIFTRKNSELEIGWHGNNADVFSNFLFDEKTASKIINDKNLIKTELQKIVRAVGVSNVNLFLDDNCETACTNGKIIKVGTKIIEDDSSNFNKIDKLIGLCIHECCHCLYTDFKYVLNNKMATNKLIHHIHNIIEDEMIETKLGRRYPGYINFITTVKYGVFNEYSKDFIDKCEDEVSRIMSLFLYIVRYPKYISHIDDKYKEKYNDLFVKIYNTMKSYGCMRENPVNITYTTMRAAVDIYNLIKEYIKEEMNDSNNGNNETTTSTNNDYEIEDKINKADIISVIDKIFDVCKSTSEVKSKVDIYNINRELNNEYNKNRESSKNIINSIEGVNSGTDKDVIKTNDITIYDNTKYNEVYNSVKQYIKYFNKIVIPEKTYKVYNDVLKYRRNGTMDPSRLVNAMMNENTVFMQRIEKRKKNNNKFALVLMLDESGSMYGIPFIESSNIAVLIYESFKNNPDVEVYVYGHGDYIRPYITKNDNYKNTIPNRNLQCEQNESVSYTKIIKDVRKQTKLPIIAVNITDAYYIALVDNIKETVNMLSKKHNASFNCISISTNESSAAYVNKLNDTIYGENNYIVVNTKTDNIYMNICSKLSGIIYKNWKLQNNKRSKLSA